jgi:class 3 adenylate cyclase
MMTPQVHYARSGNVNIAYQVVGAGPLDLVLVPGFVSHLELDWDERRSARFLQRLASFCRLIRFDKRGTGLSDRPGALPDLETRMDDVRAVMDDVGSKQAALFGYSEGGPLSITFAATHPSRTSALVLYGTYAKRSSPDQDYPWARTWDERRAYAESLAAAWAWEADLRRMNPSADEEMARWWARRARAAASPGAARELILMNSGIDVRAVLSHVHAPALVLHRTGDRDARVEEGRYLAARIPGARFLELPGDDHVPWVDGDQIVDEVEEFLTGTRPPPDSDRVLATLLFTDIVGSTDRATRLGDRRWRELLARHHHRVRSEIARHGGEELDTAGDGSLASFDGPTRAIRCAVAVRRTVHELGMDIRAGLHTGEIERRDGEVSGIGIHIAARVVAEAGAGEILVSSTVQDLVAGSGIEFRPRGAYALKGVPGRWQLSAVIAT